MDCKVIARIHTEFPTKFGIPRQSGLARSLRAAIVFEPEYRREAALRGIEGFSHLWLLWEFSEAKQARWSPTVRPPRLGGNRRLGVFATRSPFRPNALGLSCVKLEGLEKTSDFGTVLRVSGADLMDGTPIFDIKPYLPYADCKPEATGGFAAAAPERLEVQVSEALLQRVPQAQRPALLEVLSLDPRPHYQNDPLRSYGMAFAGLDIRFRIDGGTLLVTDIRPAQP